MPMITLFLLESHLEGEFIVKQSNMRKNEMMGPSHHFDIAVALQLMLSAQWRYCGVLQLAALEFMVINLLWY
ncbi:hypothetical protein SADUNF_Sadunf15G0109200 [Salix dunnii]|uniref:Uncharacterized protein n=1 Tax=Salix dunnii TaxID=1413687 RepID=A0A835JEK6_9ROSI|nr:hypothetical protein SADUNF_Sadunf15G0109200 [Salix dunnii]